MRLLMSLITFGALLLVPLASARFPDNVWRPWNLRSGRSKRAITAITTTTTVANRISWGQEVWLGLFIALIVGVFMVLGVIVILFAPDRRPPKGIMVFAFSLAAGMTVAISAEMFRCAENNDGCERGCSWWLLLAFICGGMCCGLLCRLRDYLRTGMAGQTVTHLTLPPISQTMKAASDEKVQVDVCVDCGTAFPDAYCKFCRKCGGKRPEPPHDVNTQGDGCLELEEANVQVTCVCGTAFPTEHCMFCRVCGEKRPGTQEQANDDQKSFHLIALDLVSLGLRCDDPKSFHLIALDFFSLTLHTFPEALAIAVSALSGVQLGMKMCIVLAFKNIPLGIALAVSVHRATKSIKQFFLWAFLSGLTELLFALSAMLVLQAYPTIALLSYLLTAAAGMMCYMTLAELLRKADSSSCWRSICFGFCIGIAAMVSIGNLIS